MLDQAFTSIKIYVVGPQKDRLNVDPDQIAT